jgi:glyoxylase-like metal-dependent hydrolase (beta-lactamase superfamily II)
MSRAGTGRFEEVADRCFVARYPEWDVNVGLVVGDAAALVVDTRASAVQGARLRDDVRRVTPVEVRWVVNTHQHFDHTFGNGAFPAATIHAHENAAAGMRPAAERIKAALRADPEPDPSHPEITREVIDEVLATELRLPDATFASVSTLDLGDRYLELVHPGRGHTDGDVVIRVPDTGLLYVGDLVEESGPPMFGSDSFPLDWAGALDVTVGMLTETAAVVPGHGRVVDRAFVLDQREQISQVAELVRALAGQGVPVDDALDEGARVGWPFPTEGLDHAVRRGYAQLSS